MRHFLLLLSFLPMITMACAKAESSQTINNQQSTTNIMQNQEPTVTPSSDDVVVKVQTNLGDFTLLLYGDTPAHRDNFVKLVDEGFYNGTLFHRVINQFMAQAGDPESKGAQAGQRLGSGGPGYTLPAEIVYPKHFHKRGALAAARQSDQVNPERRSSGSQFYVVTGNRYMPAQLDAMEKQLINKQMQDYFNQLARQHMNEIQAMQLENDTTGLKNLQQQLIAQTEAAFPGEVEIFTPEMREAYSTVGGAPHLDGQYTVFGEVIEGMDVIDKIEKVETDQADRPLENVVIERMTIVSDK